MGARRFNATIVNIGEELILMSGQTGFDSTVTVMIANQGLGTANIFLAYIDSTDINDLSTEDYLVYNKSLSPGNTLEFKGIAVEQDHSLVVRSDVAPVSAIAFGYENETV